MSLDHEARGLEGADLPWPVLRAMVLLRDAFTCAMCGDFATQVDHIFAQVHGGSDHPMNLQAACRPCNQRKGNALMMDRPEFFTHLTLDQVRHVASEIRDARDVADQQVRFFSGAADVLAVARGLVRLVAA